VLLAAAHATGPDRQLNQVKLHMRCAAATYKNLKRRADAGQAGGYSDGTRQYEQALYIACVAIVMPFCSCV
jgi:hypothetical protein